MGREEERRERGDKRRKREEEERGDREAEGRLYVGQLVGSVHAYIVLN